MNTIINMGDYYPWYDAARWKGEPPHWLPLLGQYDSNDEDLIRYHIAMWQYATRRGDRGPDRSAMRVSYWPGEHVEARDKFARIAAEMRMPWCFYLEAAGRETWDGWRGELETIRARYVNRNFEHGPSTYMISAERRPRIFVFNNTQPSDAVFWSWKSFTQNKWWTSLRVHPREPIPGAGWRVDHLHAYQPSEQWLHVEGHSVAISKSFWHSLDSKGPSLLMTPEEFRYMVIVANHPAGPQEEFVHYIINEFPEQSNVEGDEEHGMAYILAMREALGMIDALEV